MQGLAAELRRGETDVGRCRAMNGDGYNLDCATAILYLNESVFATLENYRLMCTS